MKQLTANNPQTGMTIIERYLDGTKFMKVTPDNLRPLILENLKKQMANIPVVFSVSDTGWIRIEKTGTTDELEKAAGKLTDGNDVDEELVLNKEAAMLKAAGFTVKVEDI